MKKYLSLLASLFVALGFIGCGGSSEEPVTPDPPAPPVIDVEEPSNLKSQDGLGRVELSWTQDCSADIAKTTIYWNSRKNSQTVEFSASATSGTQNEGVELTLAEGEYDFELINIDSEGNKSDAVEVSARSYGEEYCSGLATRCIEGIYYEDDTAFITWEDALEGEIRTEYTYTDSESEEQVKAEVAGKQEQIKVLPNEVIAVQTVYQPERCMDELFSPVAEFVVPEPEPVVVPVVKDAASLDGMERVEISWTRDPAEDVAKTIISWNDGEASQEVSYADAGEQESYQIREMIDLAEGEYTFVLKNIDAKGNESEAVAIEARAYGEEYCSQLPTREILSMVYEDDHTVVEWAEADAAAIRTEYRYIDLDGAEQVGIVTETTHNLPATPLSVVKVQSVYQPERCMDELWSPVKEYTVPEQIIIDVVEPTNPSSMNGLGRVQLSWEQDCSADIAKTRIVWDGGEEEVDFTPASESGVQAESLELTLAEGDYTFSLINLDSAGNESDAVEVSASSYGEQYAATLPTRELVSISFAANSNVNLDLVWGTACEGELRTKYSYTHTETGVLTVKTAQPTSTKSAFVKAAPGTMILVQSVFKPKNCLDELTSAGVEYPVPEAPAGPDYVNVKVMQFNVCVGNRWGYVGNYGWSQRSAQMAALIEEQAPDVICMQELSPAGYYSDIMKAINNSYSNYVGDLYSGVYGERAGNSNEGVGLAYNSQRFEKVSGGMFWLNNTPDSAGLYSASGLSANYNRIAVWVRLRDKTTQQEFVVTSTHIDNANNATHAASNYAVMNGQVQILINNSQARSGGDDDKLPMIIAGDMNANPDKSPIAKFSSNGYTDAYTVAESLSTASSTILRSTMVDVSGTTATQNYACYDYIFVKNHHKVLSYNINPATYGGVIMSDHNSVTAEIQLEYEPK